MFQSIMYEAFNLQELSSATEVLAAELTGGAWQLSAMAILASNP